MNLVMFAVRGLAAVSVAPAGKGDKDVNDPGKVVAGGAAYIEFEIRDRTVVPSRPVPAAELSSVTISLIDPDTLLAAVTDAAMTNVADGRWKYLHQTADDDSHGAWLAVVKAVKAGAGCPPAPDEVYLSAREPVFVVTGPSGV